VTDNVLPYSDRGRFEYLPYDERAPLVFRLVADLIQHEDESLALEHVGSTAVSGCPGKGFIDALVLVSSDNQLPGALQAVERAGFAEHDFGQGYPGARGAVRLDAALFRVHLQIVSRDSAKAHEMIAFRELLKGDPQLVMRYVSRKQRLITSGRDRNPEYTEGKGEVIEKALRQAKKRGVVDQITFRRYQLADHDAVASAFAACTHQLGFTLDPWNDDMHQIPAVYLETGGEFIVGDYERKIVSFAGLRRDSADRAEIRRVGVHPDAQRRGFARAMIRDIEDRAAVLGFSYLYLDTSIAQVAAQRLYRACGYRENGHVEKNGIECIVYNKELLGLLDRHEAID